MTVGSIKGLGGPIKGDESDHGMDDVGVIVLGESESDDTSSAVPFPPSFVLPVFGTDMNDSACHSYQTFRSLVIRQIETCSSELLGR